ncbi:exo-beta-N-acetylmuramidase NamZ domain-containing protein, partial [Clostridium sp. HCS.1]|uniref:exo-beta-N-acetylmuramidase NamZ domain-containing protein n=1 Tax=Clostridium sp. HCS.1 TaxID=3238594 RepID=UPI003A0FC4F6
MKSIVGNKKIGLVTSTSGVNKSLKYTVDIINENFNLISLFSPEHGLRGNLQAGEEVENYIYERTGVKVYSLYVNNKKPSSEM